MLYDHNRSVLSIVDARMYFPFGENLTNELITMKFCKEM